MALTPSLKNSVLFSALLSLVSVVSANISSVPVGYMAIKIAGGAPGAPVTTSFAVPLTDEPSNDGATTGRITALAANQITVADAGWAPGKLATKATPYAVRIKTGTNAGLTLVITANTTDTLTVETAADLTKLGIKKGASGNLIQLIPIDTVDSLFGTDTLLGAQNAQNADIVYLGANSQNGYFYNTSLNRWVSIDGTTKDRGRTRIPPEAAVSVARIGPTTTLFFDGRVPETAFVVNVANSGDTYTHTGFPTATTLGELSLQTKLPNWVSAAKPGKADKISIASGKQWVTYYHTGTQWRRTTDTSGKRDGVAIKAGVPIRITRVGTATGSTPLKISRPYKID